MSVLWWECPSRVTQYLYPIKVHIFQKTHKARISHTAQGQRSSLASSHTAVCPKPSPQGGRFKLRCPVFVLTLFAVFALGKSLSRILVQREMASYTYWHTSVPLMGADTPA